MIHPLLLRGIAPGVCIRPHAAVKADNRAQPLQILHQLMHKGLLHIIAPIRLIPAVAEKIEFGCQPMLCGQRTQADARLVQRIQLRHTAAVHDGPQRVRRNSRVPPVKKVAADDGLCRGQRTPEAP